MSLDIYSLESIYWTEYEIIVLYIYHNHNILENYA